MKYLRILVFLSLLAFMAVSVNPAFAAGYPDAKPRTGLVELYVAWFNRAPDINGLEYWESRMASGTSLNQVSASFWNIVKIVSAQPGYDFVYTPNASTFNDDMFVTQVYEGVTNRTGSLAPDASELNYWTGRLAAHGHNYGAFMVEFIKSFKAANIDTLPSYQFSAYEKRELKKRQDAFINKVSVGLMAADRRMFASGSDAYKIQEGEKLIAGVNHNYDTVITAMGGPANPNTLKVLIIGQSNSANFGDYMHDCVEFVTEWNEDSAEKTDQQQEWGGRETAYGDSFNSADSRLFRHSPAGGSIWGLLGDMILENNASINNSRYGKVMFDTRGVGSSPIQAWSQGIIPPNPDGGNYIDVSHSTPMNELERALDNNQFDVVLITQGEQNTWIETTQKDYTDHLRIVINRINQAYYPRRVPIYIAEASLSYYKDLRKKPDGRLDTHTSQAVVNGQNAIINEINNVRKGPRNDTLRGDYYRNWSDGVHFNETGIRRLAQMWYNVITD